MVKPEAVRPRLTVLQNALTDLRRYRDRFEKEQFLADRDAQNMVLFAFYLASQAAIDLATHAVADAEGTSPARYQDAFREAARIGPTAAGSRRETHGLGWLPERGGPPDMFYVNDFADRIFKTDPVMFNQLFG
jgi:hypothetical protein